MAYNQQQQGATSEPLKQLDAVHTVSQHTLGIVVDIFDEGGRNLAEETVRQTEDPEFRKLLSMAHELRKRYIVAAGRFNGKGISGVVCNDSEHLVVAFDVINARMDEIGSCTTVWLIKPDACVALLEKSTRLQATKSAQS